MAAKDLVKDHGPAGKTGHVGSDKSSVDSRIKRYGITGGVGENCSYGSKTGQDIIMGLFVDDGVKGRAHRVNLMNA